MASEFSLWLGLLTAWQPVVRKGILRESFWTMNILREPVGSCKAFYQPASEVIKYHFCYSLLVEVIISLPRSKKKAHRPLPFKGEMTNNWDLFFKSQLGHCLPSPYLNMSLMLSLMLRHCNGLLINL